MKLKALVEQTLQKLKRAGASEAEVFLQAGTRLTVEVRNQHVEHLTQAETRGIGLRVIVDRRMSFVHSSDLSDAALDDVAQRAIALAREAAPDEFNHVPQTSGSPPRVEILDPIAARVATDKKIALTRDVEKVALSFDPVIKRSDGSTYSEYGGETFVANSKGIFQSFRSSFFSLGVTVVAEKDGEMQPGGYSSESRFLQSLATPADIGKRAAKRAATLVGGRPVKTQEVPIVFEPQAGESIFWGISGAVNGESVLQGLSFLAGRLGEKVASEGVSIVDDGSLARGIRTTPVDAEGVATSRRVLVEKGVLKGYLYNTYAAAKARTRSTGNAFRESYEELPGVAPSNLYIQKGDLTPEQIVKKTKEGFYVFETSGFGVNPVTGDYSMGAVGTWVKDGEIRQPVARVTIASNLAEMLKEVDLVGNDLVFDRGWCCPHFRVATMMVSGL